VHPRYVPNDGHHHLVAACWLISLYVDGRSAQSSQPQGSIEISEVLNVCPNKENGPAAFDVITNGRFFSFMAEDEREMEEWVCSLAHSFIDSFDRSFVH